MGKLIPIILALLGLGAGAGAGMMLQPEPEPVVMNPCGDVDPDKHGDTKEKIADEAPTDTEFVKINNQFVVPVVADGRVSSLVVLSLNVEVDLGGREAVYKREPKLRDEFLQVMFNHANTGGFDGMFTQSSRLDPLRAALLEVAQSILGKNVKDVLVTNIVRQDT
ncbi:Flagellar basal body-associated protein FliL [Aliiroseovarius halocynthiae]|uniref:Flagellar protein FliL n=1 Tax=Aliiroseovarius halocynthiae TaxID=985055 RepID=A0A545SLN9_9RHOB|nr:flagellar basal body-associated FliL family protein [Aliiroseovarius halocynthiae]TQV65893.1 flagellar basal body-associated FliL family protein [Aliiroseovarius halocynthiae]SMR83476.1 Flagellar basal body-associated protein FliL [Aliiroseovarius halocynthiae]